MENYKLLSDKESNFRNEKYIESRQSRSGKSLSENSETPRNLLQNWLRSMVW
jgi:hypothetical protein